MEKHNKRIFIFGFIGAGFLFAGGFLLGYFYASHGYEASGTEDTERVELIENSVERVGSGLKEVEGRISETGCELGGVGAGISKSRTVVGNIEARFDRIRARNKDATKGVEGIESALESLEQTISEIEKTK